MEKKRNFFNHQHQGVGGWSMASHSSEYDKLLPHGEILSKSAMGTQRVDAVETPRDSSSTATGKL
jgi:hypothetical protein